MTSRALKAKFRNIPLPTILLSAAIVVAFSIAQLSGSEYGHLFEGAIIAAMGAWRIFKETDRYQRFRIGFIVIGVTLAWFVLPGLGLLFDIPPSLAQFFPSIHEVGSVAFFAFLIPVILFGRGADCGWFCPCVATRETAGYAFRGTTPRGKFWWYLRFLKWPATAVALLFIPAVIFGDQVLGPWWPRIKDGFAIYIFYGYFGSFLLLPVLGNRNFCRWGCPYGAIWGLVGKYGFFRLKSQPDACTSCKKCEKVCDMGIPLADFTSKKETIRNLECMGCGRCVEACPKGCLDIYDIRGRRQIPRKVEARSAWLNSTPMVPSLKDVSRRSPPFQGDSSP